MDSLKPHTRSLSTLKIALAQINTTVGDIDGNTERIIDNLDRAGSAGADLAIFPELAIFGYPPKDLVLRDDLIERNRLALQRVASRCTDLCAVVGYVGRDPSRTGTGLLNAAAFCSGGRVTGTYAKMLLPCYDVFDERRYFTPGSETATFGLPHERSPFRIGLSICEDLWNDRQFEGRSVYGVDPVKRTAAEGVDLLVNLSASPYRAGVQSHREALFSAQAKDHRIRLVSVNQIGGNDDLIFDGASLALDAKGRVVARAKAFDEDLLLTTLDSSNRVESYPAHIESIRAALVVGVRDYVEKCGFSSAVVGLSGGIDSAVAAAIAVEAVGSKRVHGVAMPSRFSSTHSVEDAKALAKNLGIELRIIPIECAHSAMEVTLAESFSSASAGSSMIAEENIQARIRGGILMALSNKFGSLLITTGNKSELAVGYCTLYGDMCGGLAVLSDVPKTLVYELARHMNAACDHPLIPQRTIDKPPSAELKHDQTDQDTLPPYDTLDAILEQYIEHDCSVDTIVDKGFDREMVERIAEMVDRSEHKRIQAPIGIKVTSKAFGSGRRMPVAARFR